jgi:Tol biopolymer transport system component
LISGEIFLDLDSTSTSLMHYCYFAYRKIKYSFFTLLFLSFLLSVPVTSKAQYFGQNKVRYKHLKFKVYRTPHFDIYYYVKNDSLVKRFAQESEIWYKLHQQVFKDTFKTQSPIILYNDHPDFEQTSAIDGAISIGTGGVTEGLKNRVVMPVMETNQTTRHVLGHELVHAFQYHSLKTKDTALYESLDNVPLWMVEGMAEYFSLGKHDSFTAMWMRDAYLNHDIPSIKDLSETDKYFPYRYGEAFWSFIGTTYGDTVIMPFFKKTARFGLKKSIEQTFCFSDTALSVLWKRSVEATYAPYLKDTLQVPTGKLIVSEKNAGKMNIAPSISPDGQYLIFLSEKDLFTVDLYLANAATGDIIRKLSSKVSNTNIEEFNFIESSGAWSPDGKAFATSIFKGGRNRMLVISIPDGKILTDVAMGKAKQFSNLSWSPDGKKIVFQGLAEGQGDLYLYDVATKKVSQLTNDNYSDIQPCFSRDNKKILFSSDRTTYDRFKSQEITFNLAELDLATGKITNIMLFNGANNLDPQYAADGKQIYFLSDRDGFRNLYRYDPEKKSVEQLTNYFTGISGITEFSPAISISTNDDIVYSYYRRQKYNLYNAKASQFKVIQLQPDSLTTHAGALSAPEHNNPDIVNHDLGFFLTNHRLSIDSIKSVPFHAHFKMDYITSTGIGVGVSTYGVGLASGLQGVFSDITGRNQIYAGVSVNGQLVDVGAQLAYINQQGRWNLGAGISHIPFQYANYNTTEGNHLYQGSNIYSEAINYDLVRIFQDQLNIFASYPFSKVTRMEFGSGYSHYYSRVDRYTTYYDTLTNSAYDSEHTRLSARQYEADYPGTNINSFYLYQASAALVGDNSFFGVTAPLNGFRYRLEADYDIGSYRFFAPTIDIRKYIRLAPFTLAARLYGYGRFGQADGLYPLFLGYPFLVRGYEPQTFYNNTASPPKNGFTIDQLSGSRIAVANFEVRFPFTGPARLSYIHSQFLFTDLNLFFDAGLAWNAHQKVYFSKNPPVIGSTPELSADGSEQFDSKGNILTSPVYGRVPVTSAGFSVRINVFGYFVLEPYLALPFNRTDVKKPVFGLTFAPGW